MESEPLFINLNHKIKLKEINTGTEWNVTILQASGSVYELQLN